DEALAGDVVSRRRVHDGTTGFHIDAARPVERDDRLRRKQLACRGVQYIEVAVLRRLHDDVAILAVDLQVRHRDLLNSSVVPRIPLDLLVVPDVLAGLGFQRDDGRQEQVIALATRVADLRGPRRTVANADEYQVRLGVVRDAVPDSAA